MTNAIGVSRRKVLGGVGAAAAMTVVPMEALRALLPVVEINTLRSLAAKGEFGSAELYLPADVLSADWEFFLNGEPIPKVYVKEFYSPADANGWIVAYNKDTGGESLLTGRVTYKKTTPT